MNHNTPPPDDSWESDAVWKLLDDAAPIQPRASFADDLVRMAKLEPAPQPWWRRLFAPAPLAGLVTATAAVALGVIFLNGPSHDPGARNLAQNSIEKPAQDDAFADLQDLAETEVLFAAVDHLDNFSDEELGNLIGF